jgi:hypothetical protein
MSESRLETIKRVVAKINNENLTELDFEGEQNETEIRTEDEQEDDELTF